MEEQGDNVWTCVCLFVCLFVRLFVCLFVACWLVCLFVGLFVFHLSVCLLFFVFVVVVVVSVVGYFFFLFRRYVEEQGDIVWACVCLFVCFVCFVCLRACLFACVFFIDLVFACYFFLFLFFCSGGMWRNREISCGRAYACLFVCCVCLLARLFVRSFVFHRSVCLLFLLLWLFYFYLFRRYVEEQGDNVWTCTLVLQILQCALLPVVW